MVQSLAQEDSLEEGMATLSSILSWRISWMGEPGGLQSMGLQRVGYDQSDLVHMHVHIDTTCSNCQGTDSVSSNYVGVGK